MTIPLDQARIDAFGQKMVETLNHAGLALMISIGHRNGLFDVLSRLPAATSERIAVEAGQNERYVREWLGAMVTGGVVEYRPEDRTYHLPAERASWLTRASSPNNSERHVPHAGHLGFESCPHRHRTSLRAIPVHNLLYALHVGLARGWGAGARCDVGQGKGDRDATRGRFRAGACRDAAARPDELLLHRHAELVIRLGADPESTTKPTELHPSVDRNSARGFLPSSHYSLSRRSRAMRYPSQTDSFSGLVGLQPIAMVRPLRANYIAEHSDAYPQQWDSETARREKFTCYCFV